MDDIILVCEREKADAARIILYPEGIFYKAYGYSAFRFVRNVRPYRVKKHFYKKLNGEICSIGFPKSALAQIEASGWQVSEAGNRLEIGGSFAPVDETDFRQWMDAVPLVETKARPQAVPVQPVPVQADAATAEVLRSLQEFAIESATPLQCMMFLSELKQRLSQ